jgi:hypothetical protein
MKIMAATILAAAVTTGAAGEKIIPASSPALPVCLQRAGDGPSDYLVQGEVSKIFSSIPVTIAWKRGTACESSGVIHIRIREETPAKLLPGALAYARPYEGTYIEIFYDRIRDMAKLEQRPHLLAYVLAHEITHILQGVARHSDTGIMKARWNDVDLEEIRRGELAFAPEDIPLIEAGRESRTQRLEAFADAPIPVEW